MLPMIVVNINNDIKIPTVGPMSFEYDHCFGLFLKQNIPVMIT